MSQSSTPALGRARRRAIFALALPIIGGMVSQNVLNVVDTLMVGQLGPAALAAVGLGSFANFVAFAFVTGLSAGVQATAARRKGEGRLGETAVPLNGGLILVAIVAIPLSVALIVWAPAIFPLLNADPAVVELGVPYVQIRLVAMIAVGSNFAFRGYWNGVGMARLYLRTLVVMHVCNIVISYVLIFGKLGFPALGVEGAAIGTTVSTFIGTAYYFGLGRRYARAGGFLGGVPALDTMRRMVRLSVPAGVQQLAFALGLTLLTVIVGMVGTLELAAATVILNVTLVAVLPGLALGLAAASLVGEALGRGDVADARQWGWDVVKVAVVIMGALGLPLLLVPGPILSAFFDGPGAIELARLPLRLVGAFMVLDAIGLVLLNAVVGAGATRTSLVISVALQWGVMLPAVYLVGPVLGGGLLGIWIVQIGHRALQAAVFVALWKSGRWARTTV